MSQNARYRRLEADYTDLMNLDALSEFIHVKPQTEQPGWPPESYLITYTCRGIKEIDSEGAPVSSEEHRVYLYLSLDYPLKMPHLRWLTPIWHPNIEHQEPYHVCIDEPNNWWGAKSLGELVLFVGEMVQYKRYHAAWVRPYPYDAEVAQWVREVAEPNGIVGPDKPFDDRPLLEEVQIFQDPHSKVVECARCGTKYTIDTRLTKGAQEICEACNSQVSEEGVIILGRSVRQQSKNMEGTTDASPTAVLPANAEATMPEEDVPQILLGTPKRTVT